MPNVARRRLNVLLVGLGRAAALTFEALSHRNDVAVVAAVDPSPAPQLDPGRSVSRWASIDEVPRDVGVDLAIVSVPTPAHAETCRSLLDANLGVATILCEKPLTVDAAQATSLLEHARRSGVELRVLYHYAHAIEVEWAAERLERLVQDHGRVVDAGATFADSYDADLERAALALDSSWIDSGINVLSVLARVLPPTSVRAAEVTRERARVEVGLEGGAAALVETTWVGAHETKSTHFVFEDAATLTLHHRSRRVTLDDATLFADDAGPEARLDRYRRMLAAHLDRPGEVFGDEVTLTLHRLLDDAQRMGAGP